ncbi:MAG: hypothetical protein KJ971_06655 [Firmicutes bacterium]|nr:hypothetical protein [Bacillota bacterium]
MIFLGLANELGWQSIVIIAVGVILVIIFMAVLINKGKYQARYKNFYKRMDKAITKKYNGNLLNELLINNLSKDQTNTFKSLKPKGKRKAKGYFEYYFKNLPELVILKSFISSDKNKNQLVILILDESDKVIYRWDKSRKVSGFIKASNKYQMLTPFIGYLYELPLHIHEGVPFRFTNHDNDYCLSYDIVKNAKKIKRKQKPKKLSKKEMKAQAKIEAIKQKKLAKAKR